MLPSCWHDDLYQLLQNAGIPVVMLDQIPASMRHFPVDCVISDNYRGGALLAEHLWKRPHKGLDHGTVSGLLHHRAADPGLCGCISENGIDLLKQQDSFPLFLLVPLQKRSPRATYISRSLWILPIPLLLFFWLLSLRNGRFKRCQPGTNFRSSGYFLCVLWWWSAFQDHERDYDLRLTGSDKHGETCCGITFKKDPWRLYGFPK